MPTVIRNGCTTHQVSVLSSESPELSCSISVIAVALYRWRRPPSQCFCCGLLSGQPGAHQPSPSSYGHNPGPYPSLPPALPADRAGAGSSRWIRLVTGTVVVPLIALIAVRDLGDYLGDWPETPMVRFLYRADYRSLASFFVRTTLQEASVGSYLFGPWDKVALDTDLLRQDIRIRWASPRAGPGVRIRG